MVDVLEIAFSMIFWSMKSHNDCDMPDLCSWDLEERLAVSYSILTAITSHLKCHTHCTPLTNIKLLVDFKADNIGASVSLDYNPGLMDNDQEEDDLDGQEMICWTVDHTSKETSVHNRDRCLCFSWFRPEWRA